ncbi:MAG: tRNA uridine-5-carboxymethylaminomethyl(34) synthesis enzyme MnmG [Planctomycetaceae bacterium]|nr:tRNA uridine-5-carboxymethylaminomethyl(34) synthesis enzyme MnmG [Planctomycetaceae bacterium]
MYNILVIGAGHAGVEAALASARLGMRTALISHNLDTIAQMSCNPAIGGIGKGHFVREIDALGGAMGRAIDKTGIQYRMLNRRKGPAMQGPRAQADKKAYQVEIKRILEEQPNLELRQENVVGLAVSGFSGRVSVLLDDGTEIAAEAVVLCCGTFLNGKIHFGEHITPGGRIAEAPADGISTSLQKLDITTKRFRTDTPARIHARSINYAKLTEHPGDEEPMPFSFLNEANYAQWSKTVEQIPCWMAYTNPALHQFVQENLSQAPIFSGQMQTAGPRYCPSIETKIKRFGEKDRHQLFLEPEGRNTCEVYINGFSTGFGRNIQDTMLRMIEGLENVEVMRYAYGIEYDYVPPEQLKLTLETKAVERLYIAGQLNGTTGYEEAAALGLMAGTNAALKVLGREPLILRRDEAYIGVMIDDLVTRSVDEPYRMFTSRAEYRLLLQHGNADRRLTPMGHQMGLVDSERFELLQQKLSDIATAKQVLSTTHDANGSLLKYLSRPETQWSEIVERIPALSGISLQAAEQVCNDVKYDGYIKRQAIDIERMRRMESRAIPPGTDYGAMQHLRSEAREKLERVRPIDLAQASRISGITPADVAVLTVYITQERGM